MRASIDSFSFPKIQYLSIGWWLFFVFTGSFASNGQQPFPIKQDSKWGLIDVTGKLLLKPTFDEIDIFDCYGYAQVQQGTLFGLINRQGQLVLPVKFKFLSVLEQNYFEVLSESGWQIINQNQEKLLSDYETFQLIPAKGIKYKRSGKWGMISFAGKSILPPIYEEIEVQESGIRIKQQQGQGLASLTGTILLPCTASEIVFINEEVIFYKAKEKWGSINKAGEVIFPPEYLHYTQEDVNLITLHQNERKTAFHPLKAKITPALAVEEFSPFNENFILKKQAGKFGLLGWQKGKGVPAKYQSIQGFYTEIFRAKLNNKWGIINSTNEVLLDFEYEYISPVKKQQLAIIKKSGKYGLIAVNGSIQLEPIYDQVEIEGQQVKAYANNAMILFPITADGHVQKVNASKFNSYIKFELSGPEIIARLNRSNTIALDSFEWHLDADLQQWGLRNLHTGETSIDPKFDFVEVQPRYGLTLVGITKKTKIGFGTTTYQFEQLFGIVNNKIGKLVTKLEFLHIAFEDFAQGLPLARCIFTNGKYGLITQSGVVINRNLTYIDSFTDGMFRAATGGQLSLSFEAPTTIIKLKDHVSNIKSNAYPLSTGAVANYSLEQLYIKCQDCSWGFLNTTGKFVIPPVYVFAAPFQSGKSVTLNNEGWGVINRKNKTIIPFSYNQIESDTSFVNAPYVVHLANEKVGLIDTLGQVVLNSNYEAVGSFSEGLIAAKQNGKWGFLDGKGKVVIPFQYEATRGFQEGWAAVKKGGKWGFIDKSAHLRIPYQYHKVGDFSNNRTWVSMANGFIYIDKAQQQVSHTIFNTAYNFEKGVARVIQNGRYGLIDTLGNFLLSPKYLNMSRFNQHGLSIVNVGNRYANYKLLNTKGEVLNMSKYRIIKPFSEGLAAVRYQDQYGYIDTTGKLVIPAQFSRASRFIEGKAAVQKNGDCGYINKDGKTIIDFAYSKCLEFSDDRAVVYEGMRKAGLVDSAGIEIISPSLFRLINFKEGKGLMRDPHYRFYYIDEAGNKDNEYFDEAEVYNNGVAIVKLNDNWGLVNQNGIQIIPPKYTKIEAFQRGYARVRIAGLYGLLSATGKTILPVEYERIASVGQNIYKVEKGNKIGYIRGNGEWLWTLRE